MNDDEWYVFKKFPTHAGAEVLKTLLESEDVPTKIEPSSTLAFPPREVLLYVEKSLLHRAEWVIKNSEFSEEELTYLATGELPSSKEEK